MLRCLCPLFMLINIVSILKQIAFLDMWTMYVFKAGKLGCKSLKISFWNQSTGRLCSWEGTKAWDLLRCWVINSLSLLHYASQRKKKIKKWIVSSLLQKSNMQQANAWIIGIWRARCKDFCLMGMFIDWGGGIKSLGMEWLINHFVFVSTNRELITWSMTIVTIMASALRKGMVWYVL